MERQHAVSSPSSPAVQIAGIGCAKTAHADIELKLQIWGSAIHELMFNVKSTAIHEFMFNVKSTEPSLLGA